MSLTAGERLGPYEILAPIGAGGMGEVYKARDTRLNRIVALKISKAQYSERFEREARVVAALNHPHICQLYDIGPDYLVMEYVEGAPIQCPLSTEEAVRLAIQIASALEEAHSQGIIHRDLKPGNIMVNTKGSAKLLDFGLAKLLDSGPPVDALSTLSMGLTEAGGVVGTVSYMSPEQAQGQPVDTRSDIFSFGALLYEMLSGRRAFAGETSFATMSAIVRDEPSPMRGPSVLERIVRRCLNKQPAARHQTMTEVRTELERSEASGAEEQPSIAVLPFVNIGADKENEYFSDGLAEEIINVLAHIAGLKVIARTSAFAFRGKEQDIRRIAETLGVRTILEGSVRRAGNRIRVSAQLINAEDGAHLWSERYDRELADVFAIQDEIAQAITRELRLKLAPLSRYTPKLAAYEALLRGRHHSQKFTPAGSQLARQCFEQAILLDPGYAAPHAALGLDSLLATTSIICPMIEAAIAIQSEARRALELDPAENNPYFLLGSVAAAHDYDRKQAAEYFAKAMGGSSISADARWAYASFYFQPQGRFQEGREQIQAAVESDPLNVGYRAILAHLFLVSGMYSEAMVELRRALEMDESHWLANFNVGDVHMATGKFAEAAEIFQGIYRLAPTHSFTWGLLASAWARAGEKDRAKALVREHGDSPKPVWGRVAYHLWCLELEEAAKWYEEMIRQREPFALIFAYDPVVKPLRESPHWPRLAAMMNLPNQVQ